METTRDGRPCKACYSYEDMVRMAGKQADAKQRQAAANSSSSSSPSTSNKTAESAQQNGQGRQRRHDCPVDKDVLGRSTWNLLHTMSVSYPDEPTEQEQKDMRDTLTSLSKTYPCESCAADLRVDLRRNPPALQNRSSFAQWMCEMHNRVNLKLDKELFDCNRVMERWYDGWKDGSCDP